MNSTPLTSRPVSSLATHLTKWRRVCNFIAAISSINPVSQPSESFEHGGKSMGVSKAALRNLPIDQRMELMAAAEKPQVVKVVPASADIRRVLFHPRAGYFPADGGMY